MHHEYHFLWPMFWGLFALAIILTRRFTRHRERMRALDVAQRFAEKGVAAPEVLNQALAPETRRPCSPRNDIRTGAVLLAVADRFGIERAAAAITRVRDVVRSWPEFAAESGLDARLTDLIAADFVEL